MEVIRRALQSYLHDQLTRDPSRYKEFLKYKAELTNDATTPLRLVSDSDPTKR
jgi:hypothetical protein